MTRHATALLLAAVAALPAAARAEVGPIARSGAWTSFGGRADDGRPVCGVLTTGSEGRVLGFKWYVSSDHLTVVLRKRSWSIPDGVEAEVVLEFDRAGPWRARARGAGQNLEFTIPLSAVSEFERQFRAATTVRLFFPSGTEEPWVGSMAGSSGAMTSMIRCMAAANQGGSGERSAGPTQPFSPPGARPGRASREPPDEPGPGNAPRGGAAPLPKSAAAPPSGPASKAAPADQVRGKADARPERHAAPGEDETPQQDE